MSQENENQAVDTKALLLYWIQERYRIHLEKDWARKDPPWSKDPVFRTTYFCNVHRKSDKVTRFIREFHRMYAENDMLIYNTVLARFLNWPPTLSSIGYQLEHTPERLMQALMSRPDSGKHVWGGAYLITSNGMSMPKPHYLAYHILGPIYNDLAQLRLQTTCKFLADRLQLVSGIGTFLAGQVVADLKNTERHPLFSAPDKK